jgi:hypothetical protein
MLSVLPTRVGDVFADGGVYPMKSNITQPRPGGTDAAISEFEDSSGAEIAIHRLYDLLVHIRVRNTALSCTTLASEQVLVVDCCTPTHRHGVLNSGMHLEGMSCQYI